MVAAALALSGCVGKPSASSGGVSQAPVSSAPPPAVVSGPVVARVDFSLTQADTAFFGRYDRTRDGVAFSWTASGLEIRFTGTACGMTLTCDEENDKLLPRVRFYVDGEEGKTVTVAGRQTVMAAEDLPYGDHTVRLVRLSEAYRVKPLTVSGVYAGSQAEGWGVRQLAPAAAPERRIEFIGDSITCGYGNTGTAATGEFLSSQQDATLTYAAFAAQAFGADARYIAASGAGVVRDTWGKQSLLMPRFWATRTLSSGEAWDFAPWQPQVVVINAGTNDDAGGATAAEFQQGAAAFLWQVRGAYPQASIIWMYGMMGDRLAEPLRKAVEQVSAGGDGKVTLLLVEAADESRGEMGAAAHPNVAAHRDRAAKLIEAVTSVTGWKPE